MKRIHICKICNRSFPLKSLYQAHKKGHSNAPDDSAVLGSDSKCIATIKVDFDLPVDDKCDVDESADKKLSMCGICNRVFPRFDLLSHHNVLRHPHLVKSPSNSNEGRKAHDPMKCSPKGSKFRASKVIDICGKRFVSRKILDFHMTKHLAYKCNICHKGFRVYSSLWNHAWVHTDAKPYVCAVCGKGFGRLYRLKYHATIHSDDRPYECWTCRKSFKLKGTLTKHELSHKCLNLCRPANLDYNKFFALKKIYNRKTSSQQLHHKIQTKLQPLKPSTSRKIKASADCQFEDNEFAQYCSMHAKDCISQMNGKAGEVYLSDRPKRLQFKAACEKISDMIATDNDLDVPEDACPISRPNLVRRPSYKKKIVWPMDEKLAVCKIPSVTSCANATDEMKSQLPFEVSATGSKTRKMCSSIKLEKVCASSNDFSETSVKSMTDDDGSMVDSGETDCSSKEGELYSALYKCVTCSQIYKHFSSLIRHVKRCRHSYNFKLSVIRKKADAGRKPNVRKSNKSPLKKGNNSNEIPSHVKNQREGNSSCSLRNFPLKVNNKKHGSYQTQTLKIKRKSGKKYTSGKAGNGRSTSERVFSCIICGKQYKQQCSLYRHIRICHQDELQHQNYKAGKSKYGNLVVSVLEKREQVGNFNSSPTVDSENNYYNLVNEKAEKTVSPEILGLSRKTDAMSTEKFYQEQGVSTEMSYQEQGLSTKNSYQEQGLSTENSYQEQCMSTNNSCPKQCALENGAREIVEAQSSVNLSDKSPYEYLQPSPCLTNASNKLGEVVTDATVSLCRKSCLKWQNNSEKKVTRKVSFCPDVDSEHLSDDVDSTPRLEEQPFESVDCFSKASMAQSLCQQDITHSVDIPDPFIELQDMQKNSNTEDSTKALQIIDCFLKPAGYSQPYISSPIGVSVVSSDCDNTKGIQTVPNNTCDIITDDLAYVGSDSQVVGSDSQVVGSDLSNLVKKAADLVVLGRNIPFCEESDAENIVHDKEKNRSKDIKFKCNFCSKGYAILSSLKRHLKVHSSTSLVSESNSVLELACQTQYTAKNAVKDRKALNPHQKLFKCEICERRYSCLRTLINHTTKQACQRPHECTFCKRRFKSKFILKQHMLVENAKIQNKELTCENCEEMFSSNTDLELHKVESVCRSCGERIFCKYLYDTHSCQLFSGYLPRNDDGSLVVQENVAKNPSAFSEKESNRYMHNAPGTSHCGADVLYKSNYFGSYTYDHSYFSAHEESKSADLPNTTNILCCGNLHVSRNIIEQINCENSKSNIVCGRNVEYKFDSHNSNGFSFESDCPSNVSFGYAMERQLIVNSQSEAFRQNPDICIETYKAHEACEINSSIKENTNKMWQAQNLRPGSIVSFINNSVYELEDDMQSVSIHPFILYANPSDWHHLCSVCGCLFSTASELIDHEAMHR